MESQWTPAGGKLGSANPVVSCVQRTPLVSAPKLVTIRARRTTMSPWRRYIADFSGLARIVSESVHKRTLATKLSHDIQTIKRWLTTGEPNSPQDVGWVIRIALQNGLEIDRFQTFHAVYNLA